MLFSQNPSSSDCFIKTTTYQRQPPGHLPHCMCPVLSLTCVLHSMSYKKKSMQHTEEKQSPISFDETNRCQRWQDIYGFQKLKSHEETFTGHFSFYTQCNAGFKPCDNTIVPSQMEVTSFNCSDQPISSKQN